MFDLLTVDSGRTLSLHAAADNRQTWAAAEAPLVFGVHGEVLAVSKGS